MSTHVSRHELDHGVDQEELDYQAERRKKIVRTLVMEPVNADVYLSPIYSGAELGLLLDPQAAKVETWEAWSTAMQYYNAVFAVSEAEEGTQVEYLIDQQTHTLKAPGMLHCADPATWEKAFYLAVVCRDNARADALCRVPVEHLRRAAAGGKVRYNEYTYHWIAALQAYVNGTDDLVGELRSAMELSSPRSGAFGGESLDLLVFPKMEVFRRLLMGDSAKFNEALVFALESFKCYHAREDAPPGVRGILPLGLLAWACLAYDKSQRGDFSLDVESEYLPKHLVQRSWYGEFPV
ncbi:immunity 49 family protein [Nocardiopsis synnemataformans]|uniref:immunity 49 family protein n=1 Tax=Nocardiopsis synnemataformans TaxID=61305 RepID=UPI003EB7FEF6